MVTADLAVTVDLETVSHDGKAVLQRHLFLEGFDAVVGKLLDGAASQTDEMIVMLSGNQWLITGLSIAEIDLPGYPRLGEELEGTVDRSITDGGVPLPDLPVELLHTQMAPRREEELEYLVPLAGRLEPFFVYEVPECCLMLFHNAPI